MKRITPQVKAIAEAHIKAKLENKFDDPEIHSVEELKQKLHEGKTFSEVVRQIEGRFISITSSMIIEVFSSHGQQSVTNAYRSGMYKGFKHLLS